MTPRRCAKRAARRICRRGRSRGAGSSGASSVTSSFSERPSQVLHRDVVGAVPLAAVVDGDDVRVLEPPRPRTPRGGSARRTRRPPRSGRCRSFSATLPPELRVLGAVDVGHPARADAADDPVAAVHDVRRVSGCLAHRLSSVLHDLLGDRRGDRAALPPVDGSTVTAIGDLRVDSPARSAMNQALVDAPAMSFSAVPVLPGDVDALQRGGGRRCPPHDLLIIA